MDRGWEKSVDYRTSVCGGDERGRMDGVEVEVVKGVF